MTDSELQKLCILQTDQNVLEDNRDALKEEAKGVRGCVSSSI